MGKLDAARQDQNEYQHPIVREPPAASRGNLAGRGLTQAESQKADIFAQSCHEPTRYKDSPNSEARPLCPMGTVVRPVHPELIAFGGSSGS